MFSVWERSRGAGPGIGAVLLVVLAMVAVSVQGVFAQEPTPSPTERTVTHAQGETVVPFNPEVVISFDLASVDTLDALGVTVAGVPKGNLHGALAKFDSDDYLNVGTLFEPDYEAVNAAEPDLIIVAGRSAAVYPELSKIAPTIDLTGQTGDTITDLETNTLILAEVFGKQAEAAALLDGIKAQVDELKTATEGTGTALVIMTTGGSVTAIAPGGAGGASRGGLIYQTLGFQAAVEDLEAATHGEAISFEFLLEHNPDWLFVIDRDAATGSEEGEAAESMLDNDIMHETTAWQSGQIVYLDPYNWYVVMGGLSTVHAMLDELAAVFVTE